MQFLLKSKRFICYRFLRLFALSFISFFLFSQLAWSATYYVDATNGNDASNGLSASTAWKTIAKVNSSRFIPGDQILFKKGEIWREQLVPPSSGTLELPIIFGAFASGNNPSIRASNLFNSLGIWFNETGNIWYVTNIQNDPGIFVHDGQLGQRKRLKSDLFTLWDYCYEESTKRVYLYSTANPANIASNLEIAARPYVIGPQYTHYIVFENLDFRHGYTETWCGWGSTYVTFRNCNFTQSAGNHLQFHNGSDFGNVISCTFDDWNVKDTLGYAIQAMGYNGKQTGPIDITSCEFRATRKGGGSDHTAIMSDQDSWIRIIRKNLINGSNGNLADDAIIIWRLSPLANLVTIEENKIYSIGGIGITIQEIEYNGASSVIKVRRNYIEDVCVNDEYDKEAIRVRKFTQASDVEISYNVIKGSRYGINKHFGIGVQSAVGVKIYNNVVLNTDNGLNLSLYSTKLDVRNNIFMNSRNYGANVERDSSASTFGYNCVYGNYSGNYQGINPGPHDINQDPLFKDASAGDFNLLSSSPCINKGIFVGLTQDMDYRTVPSGIAPDIGAYEFNPGVTQPPINLRIN